MIMKPGCLSISLPYSIFLSVSQPILYWTLAVLSQHNIINNALTERAMRATVPQLFLCQSKHTDLSFI